MRKLILRTNYALGDIVLLTAAVRDLHRCYPGVFITDVRTPCGQLWNHNPYLRHLDENDPEVETVECDLSLIDWSNRVPYHALEGFIDNLNQQLGLHIRCTEFKGDIHLSAAEKQAASPVQEWAGQGIPFWLIFAGGRHEITIKWWDTDRYQEVVDHFRGRIQFVQAGSGSDHHPKLKGTVDLRGRTPIRQLLQLVYHSEGMLCGVTGPMHLAAAVETSPAYSGRRACVVVAGGRESAHWEQYPGHQFLHTVGALPCCASGGCWKTRTVPLGDGSAKDQPQELCLDVKGDLPHCMDWITAADVIRRIETYFAGGALRWLTPAQARAGARAVRRTVENPLDHGPLTLVNARYASQRFLRAIPEFRHNGGGRGIVICVGDPGQAAGAWVCIKLLRQLGCKLAIELWYWQTPDLDAGMRSLLEPLNVRCRDVLQVRRRQPARVVLGVPFNSYAVRHCSFTQVLLLDPDTAPVVNPEYLFATPKFRETGAMLWPAMPKRVIQPQAWHLCGLEPSDEAPMAPAPMLLDKTRCSKALALWGWYDEQAEVYGPYTHAGRDSAHLAFRGANVSFVAPSRAHPRGCYDYDLAGRRLFQHRNADRWSLFFPNRAIRGFRFERECREHLEELRQAGAARSHAVRPWLPRGEEGVPGVAFGPVTASLRAARSQNGASGGGPGPFTVVTLHDERMAGVGRITAQALGDYARCHGYRFVYHDRLIDPARHPSWNKVLAVRNVLIEQQAGWVMWVDADAMVMNHRIRVESLIPPGRDLVLASDVNGLVAGIFMIRHCEWSLKFLDTVAFLGDVNRDPDGFGPKWEQNTMKHILRHFAGFAEHAALLPQRRLNSDPATFRPGDYILHLGLQTNGNRERTFREAWAHIVR